MIKYKYGGGGICLGRRAEVLIMTSDDGDESNILDIHYLNIHLIGTILAAYIYISLRLPFSEPNVQKMFNLLQK